MGRFLAVCVVSVCLLPGVARSGVQTKLAKETAEYVLRKFGREAGEQGLETLTRRIEVIAVKYGDDAAVAVRRAGPGALRVIEEAGEHGGQAVKLLSRWGDDALWIAAKPNRLAAVARWGDDAAEALIKQGEIAQPLIEAAGKPAAAALKAVSTQNGRRLAMMAQDGQLATSTRPELLAVVSRYGDRAMDFIWRNKGALAVGAALTAFLANPEPFIDGTADLAKVAGEHVVGPIAAVPGQVAGEAARRTNWTVVTLVLIGMIGAIATLKAVFKIRVANAGGQSARPFLSR